MKRGYVSLGVNLICSTLRTWIEVLHTLLIYCTFDLLCLFQLVYCISHIYIFVIKKFKKKDRLAQPCLARGPMRCMFKKRISLEYRTHVPSVSLYGAWAESASLHSIRCDLQVGPPVRSILKLQQLFCSLRTPSAPAPAPASTPPLRLRREPKRRLLSSLLRGTRKPPRSLPLPCSVVSLLTLPPSLMALFLSLSLHRRLPAPSPSPIKGCHGHAPLPCLLTRAVSLSRSVAAPMRNSHCCSSIDCRAPPADHHRGAVLVPHRHR
jgi:hypothetical protein